MIGAIGGILSSVVGGITGKNKAGGGGGGPMSLIGSLGNIFKGGDSN